jgi:hypothetical protein
MAEESVPVNPHGWTAAFAAATAREQFLDQLLGRFL